MLNGKSASDYEKEAKEHFKKEPGKCKLLIVVDKLLTGFDAPSATYLYIDKSICVKLSTLHDAFKTRRNSAYIQTKLSIAKPDVNFTITLCKEANSLFQRIRKSI